MILFHIVIYSTENLLPVWQILIICLSKESLLSIVKPKIFFQLQCFSVTSLHIRSNCSFFFDTKQHEVTHSQIQHHKLSQNQLDNIGNSCLRLKIRVSKFLLQVYRLLSSAQLPRLASFKKKNMSFKNMLNNKGPSIDPCGIQAIIFLQSPGLLFILQH